MTTIILPGCPDKLATLLESYGLRGAWTYDSSLTYAEARTPPIPRIFGLLAAVFKKPLLQRHTKVGFTGLQLESMELLAVLFHEERHQCDQSFKQHFSISDWYEWDAWDYAIQRMKVLDSAGRISLSDSLLRSLVARREVHTLWKKVYAA